MDDRGKVDYNKLYWILKLGKDIHIDHILPLNPDKNDNNFKYYVDDNKVILKEGQDFKENNESSIGKDEFYDEYLHMFGNLRLEWANDNIKKSNKLIKLVEFDYKFNSNSKISTRSTLLIKKIVDSDFLMSTEKIKNLNNESKEDKITVLDEFSKSFSYMNYEPVSFEVSGGKHILDKCNYNNLLQEIILLFFQMESKKFIELAKEQYRPMMSDKIYISTNKKDLNRPYKLDDNLYIETNLASSYIIKFIYILVRKIGLSSGDVKIMLRKK